MNKNTDKILDELLVLQYRTGKQNALALLAKRWNQKIIRQAYWHTQNFEASKDIAQESWLVIVKGLNGLREPQRFGMWALSITSKKAIDWIRMNQRERKHENTKKEAQEEFSSSYKDEHKEEKINAVQLAMKDLPDEQRIVLSLFYLEEYSLKEISKIMNIPIGTVKSRLFNSREKLKNLLNKE